VVGARREYRADIEAGAKSKRRRDPHLATSGSLNIAATDVTVDAH
jgi:hypothetical protein